MSECLSSKKAGYFIMGSTTMSSHGTPGTSNLDHVLPDLVRWTPLVGLPFCTGSNALGEPFSRNYYSRD